jgi:hypothetical protein
MTAQTNMPPPMARTAPPDQQVEIVAAEAGPPLARDRDPKDWVIELLASMKLTVVLLCILAVLTYLGTIAQVDRGLFQAVKDYFESWYVLHDTGVTLGEFTIRVPLPGAYPVMIVLFFNLLVGGLVRLKRTWRNAGILVTHIGMALLLVAGFVKMHWSYSGHVSLYESKETSTIVSFHDYELALIRKDAKTGVAHERVVPESALLGAKQGRIEVAGAGLPFKVELHHWFDNCEPRPKGPAFSVPVPVVDGVYLQSLQLAKEREQNLAGCYATVTEPSGRTHEGILYGQELRPMSNERSPFTFKVDGTTWGLDLRRVVWDLPFSVRLDRFSKEDHPGTNTPRDFSSYVTVREGGVDRPVHIYMNQPLRKDGYVFFQTSWGPQPGSAMRGPPWYSVFEVAKNPSDAWPKYASYVILLGLLVHFLTKLVRFLNSVNYRGVRP